MLCATTTSQLPKVFRTWGALTLFTSKCASRHNCVHFFDIATSKSRPAVTVFNTFHFAPQRRALFQHCNFQKSSKPDVLCHFLLPNVLRATTACTFSISQRPKVLRTCSVSTLFTSKSASRHNGVQFFIFHLASWLRTRRFSEPTLRPSEPQNIGKT